MSNHANFQLLDSEVASGIDVLQYFLNRNSQKKLGDQYKIGDGVFVLSYKEKQNLNLLAQEEEIVKPFYTTKELGRYYGNSANKFWLIYTDSSFKNVNKMESYPNIKRHLDQFSEIMTSVNKPYGLHRSREQNLFVGEKILSVRKCAKPIFTYTNFDCYVARVFCIIKSERIDLKYLTGLLNSRIIYFWLKNKGKLQGHQLQIDKKPLLSIPIIQSKPDAQKQITRLVDKILTAKQSNPDADTSQIEAEIDKLIYQLYDLTEEEIAIVEKSL